MSRRTLIIKTFESEGRFIHDVLESGPIEEGNSNFKKEIINAYKKANELLYTEMPNNSKKLVLKLDYDFSKS